MIFPNIFHNDISIFQPITTITDLQTKHKKMFTKSIGYFVNDYITPQVGDDFSFVNNPYFLTLNKIDEFLSLKQNWDGYNSIPITSQSGQNSKKLLNFLNDIIIENISDIFPNPHGTITFEWENVFNEKMSLELGSNTYSYFVTYSNKKPKLVNGQDIFSNLGEIAQEIDNVVRSKEA